MSSPVPLSAKPDVAKAIVLLVTLLALRTVLSSVLAGVLARDASTLIASAIVTALAWVAAREAGVFAQTGRRTGAHAAISYTAAGAMFAVAALAAWFHYAAASAPKCGIGYATPVLLLIDLVTAPVTEELLFTALLFSALRRHARLPFACAAVAVAFACAHAKPNALPFVTHAAFSCVSCLLFEAYGRIAFNIALHSALNGTVTLVAVACPSLHGAPELAASGAALLALSCALLIAARAAGNVAPPGTGRPNRIRDVVFRTPASTEAFNIKEIE